MALKFFAVVSAVAGTGMWLLAFGALDDAVTNGTTAPAFTQGLTYGFFLWLVAVVLFAFGNVVQNLKVIAEGITIIADNSEAWVEAELVEEG